MFKQPRVYATNDLMVGGDKNNDDGEAVAHKRANYIIKSPNKSCITFSASAYFAMLNCSKEQFLTSYLETI